MPDNPAKPALPTFSWVGHLKDDDRELLSSYGEFFPGHPGNVIIEEGVQQTEVFVVISGELEVHSNDEDGNPVLRARVSPGETIGEISLFDPGPALATVTASEFSQLWRIADSRLIQFMEDNPGAGNVLLRTLASILAHRLRQVDPTAFGLSAYAVIDSPELEEQDAANPILVEEEEVPATATAAEEEIDDEEVEPSEIPVVATSTPAVAPAKTSPVIPLPVPASASSRPLTATEPMPTYSEDDFSSSAGTFAKPGATTRRAPAVKKTASGTQALPDPDELEPL